MFPIIFDKKIVSALAFIVFATVTLFIWQHQNKHDRELVSRHVETSAEQVRIRVEGLMNARLASLELMADRWVERQPPDFRRERFQRFTAALFRNYPGYSGIFWMDSDLQIQWANPEDLNAADLFRGWTEYLHTDNAAVLNAINNKTGIAVTPCVLPAQGGSNFYVVRSLLHKDKLHGYLGGFFSVGRIMSLCLTKELLNDFNIEIKEGNRTIYRDRDTDQVPEAIRIAGTTKLPRAAREIRFGGKIWNIELTVNPAFFPMSWHKNAALLVFGLIFSGSLAALLYHLIKRMKLYKESRDQAVREVDERRRIQAALQENESKLQVLLAELTTKNAELELFVYTVSHDLKTPIVTIEGFIGALWEDFSDRISETGVQYLRYMSDAARKMELLINDLLNLSRIGRLEEKKTEFSMEILVQDAIDTLLPQIRELGISVNIQKDLPAIYAVRKRMGQAAYNLLSNAIKYIGSKNPDPRIDIGCTQQGSEQVFWIRDNGIGIDPRYFEKIFQIFERLPSAKSIGEGTGVGLAIVKRIIEHHGGRIWLESEPGDGTTFYFTIKGKEGSAYV